LDFFNESSPKQQSTDRHGTQIRHIIMILSHLLIARIPYCCMLSEEVANTNFIVFSLT